MTVKERKVIEEAMRLPLEARAALAGHLIESLDASVDSKAEAGWRREIEKRIKELEEGTVKPLPWSLARRKILRSNGRRST